MKKIDLSEVKASKLLACDPEGQPYSLLPGMPETKTGQGYMLVFENGDSGILMSHIPEAHGPQSNGYPIAVGQEYRYQTYKSAKGTGMVDVTSPVNNEVKLTAKDIAAAVPGVTTADKVSPQLREPLRTFEEAANATKKVSKEQLEAEAKGVPHNPIPDNVPRKGVVKSAITNVKDDFKGSDGVVLHKYAVTMEDGTAGNMWVDGNASAPKPGDTINYTLDPLTSKGTPYKDGTKRIDLVPEGSAVGKELLITRMACVNSAIALVTALPSLISGDGDTGKIAQTLDIAKELEAHVMRSND